ncbi:LacI family DNA-binding transcriptional regulator [Kineococcus sp. R86509]|uniref:LacI family DNA-binding transcriptional regulator n=1 Tax=Kineococcus sp. R86509 TaxID=3093851 RepID=UPI0036D3FEF1
MRATYKDLQRATGLSLATISKYFNGGTVREENRAALDVAARDLGFRVNAVARSLRTRRSQTVGVLLPELDNDFHLSVIAGVEEVLAADGVGVLVRSSRSRSGGAADDAVADLLDRQVDGIVAVPSPRDTTALSAAAARGVPLVLIDRLVDGLVCDAVVLDNAEVSAGVVADLVARGHRRIAVLAGPDEVWSLRERLAGFRRAMRRAGLPVPRGVVVGGPLTVAAGREGMARLLALEPRPTAVFALNQELTVGALTVLAESGLTVPDDVSFVGFDARDVAALTRPRTAVVVQPVREIARAAAEMVRDRLRETAGGQSPPRRVVLSGEHRPGPSVGPPPL